MHIYLTVCPMGSCERKRCTDNLNIQYKICILHVEKCFVRTCFYSKRYFRIEYFL